MMHVPKEKSIQGKIIEKHREVELHLHRAIRKAPL